MISKLEGMPQITYINIYKHAHKRQHMENMFGRYEIDNAQHFSAIVPNKPGHPYLNIGATGCMLSHLTIISDFYKNSKDDMMIVMEDDVDISSIDNWDFSWKEFLSIMPEFEILQLLRNQGERDEEKQQYARLKKWGWLDKSTAAYIITKDYAKKIYDIYQNSVRRLVYFPNLHDDPDFPEDYKVGPVADYALYKNFNSWSTCIFKQVLKFDDLWSSTSTDPNPPEWFIRQNKEINDFWSVPRGLSEITISQ